MTGYPERLETTELQALGGFLRFEECGYREELGEVGFRLAIGWPKHHGYTMRWWTQRQIDAGEVPELRVPVPSPSEGKE